MRYANSMMCNGYDRYLDHSKLCKIAKKKIASKNNKPFGDPVVPEDQKTNNRSVITFSVSNGSGHNLGFTNLSKVDKSIQPS